MNLTSALILSSIFALAENSEAQNITSPLQIVGTPSYKRRDTSSTPTKAQRRAKNKAQCQARKNQRQHA